MPGPTNPATPQAPAAGAPGATTTPASNVAPSNPAPGSNPTPGENQVPVTPAAATPAPGTTPAAAAPPANQVDSAEAAAAAAVKAAAEGTPWYESLPEAQHEAMKTFATPEDAVAAIEAGKQYTTAKSVEDYTFTFADPATDQAAPAIVSYKQHCLDNGISPEQAQKSLEFQTNLISEATAAAKVAGEQQLRADWGNDFDGNLTQALTALNTIDTQTGGTLSAKLKVNGGANDPDILKALHWVGSKIGEDNLGAGGPGGGGNTVPITSEEAYAELYGNAK